ncbi:unnamed protein product [Pieris brassicae]|uniref:Uncharacterized protein n=1 Tax=Pieris brassicae TaxID=7116 RepID=A0A9P0TK96_PIEBR|nr:unnamed protein product [Pieris brassicae]
MSKTSIPSPARSHGAITPRRVRLPPKRTRSLASPILKQTPRLTNIMEDAFQWSPLPQRQSILNDDTDIQEPLRKSWWKNLNENSRDMQELYENMNPPVANNVLDDINIEPSSPEKEFSIEIPDSSDGESIQSIATPQRKNIFSHKESTKQNYFKNMTIVQQKRKYSSQQSSDSDDSINIVPKKIFNYTKDKSIEMLPKELLKNLKKDRANTSSSSIDVPLKCRKSHNLFGKEPKTNPKISDMGLNNVPSASDVDMHEISPKQIFTFNRRSSVKLHVRSSIQSVIDEDWSNPLPSSTMIGSMSDEETPNHKKISEKSVHLQEIQNKSIDQENSLDNTLVRDNNDIIENPNLSKTQLQLKDTSADHNETLVNQSISKNNKSQLKDTSGNHNQTHFNKSIFKETEKSFKNSNNNQIQNDKNCNTSIPANIENEGLGKEHSNMTLKDNTRVSEGTSNSSVNNSGWDSHRTTRKTMRQTFGKDFTPRKSLRTLVMEKTAKRHTVGNFRSQDISKKTNISNIYQTNNTHNKTEPSKYFNYNDPADEPPETDDNKSINEESQINDNLNIIVEINNEIEKQSVVELKNQLVNQEQLAEPNDKDETINQMFNHEGEIYKESSHYDEDDQIADQEEMVVSNNDDEAENRSEENDEVEQFTNDEQNQSIDQEQVAESYNNYEAENSTDVMNQKKKLDCANASQSNDEKQMTEINNEVGNQTEEDEKSEVVVTDDEAEDVVQEELRETTSDMPNESYDKELVAETDHEYEDENISGGEQEEIIEPINDANESACEEQMAESSYDEDTNQTENEREDEVENHSEDEEQEEIIQSDSEQQIEENDDSDNQYNNNASNNDEMSETNDQDSYAEKTNNLLNDNEDISQMPQANSTEYPIFDSTQAKEATKKGVNRQKMAELIEKIRVENAEKKKRFEAEVNDWRKNLKPQNTNTFFKVPQKPAIKRPKPIGNKKVKPADKMFFNVLPPEFFEDIKYKPPKRFQPRNAAWANKHLYTFLEQKLEPKYDYKARVRAEKIVEMIYKFTQDIRRLDVAPEPAVTNLKQEMARLKIIDTHFDFYEFIIDFLPQDIRHKVVPSGVNLIPLPRPSVYSSIVTQTNC